MKKSLYVFAALLSGACTQAPSTAPTPQAPAFEWSVIPRPAAIRVDASQRFVLDTMTTVNIDANADSSVAAVAAYVKTMLSPMVRRDVIRGAPSGDHAITLSIAPSSSPEGYAVQITPNQVRITAPTAAGLFYGAQTVRQLLPVSVEHRAAVGRKLWLPSAEITDAPRFAWRGMMIDVSRHFLPPRDIKRFIDNLALYKINHLHLHLGDDQGWRVEIKSHPELATIGGSTQVGGGPGGYFTQDEFRDIVAYASSRFITIVPEIDMPAHINAAQASIPELNCNRVSPPLYTGIAVGFSALCVDSAAVYPIMNDVVREIASMSPGPYFHIGGDEVKLLNRTQYIGFIEKMQDIVNANGKNMIGWGEIAPANLKPTTVVQSWVRDSSVLHAARGGKIILSSSSKLYLDMGYDTTTILGLHWAGYHPLRDAYDWDPATFIAGVGEPAILGVEAPLWAETVVKREDYEYMAFPRIIAVSELGWTAQSARDWNDFRHRLDLQWPRLAALGINAARQ
jgi:hexosaminidase